MLNASLSLLSRGLNRNIKNLKNYSSKITLNTSKTSSYYNISSRYFSTVSSNSISSLINNNEEFEKLLLNQKDFKKFSDNKYNLLNISFKIPTNNYTRLIDLFFINNNNNLSNKFYSSFDQILSTLSPKEWKERSSEASNYLESLSSSTSTTHTKSSLWTAYSRLLDHSLFMKDVPLARKCTEKMKTLGGGPDRSTLDRLIQLELSQGEINQILSSIDSINQLNKVSADMLEDILIKNSDLLILSGRLDIVAYGFKKYINSIRKTEEEMIEDLDKDELNKRYFTSNSIYSVTRILRSVLSSQLRRYFAYKRYSKEENEAFYSIYKSLLEYYKGVIPNYVDINNPNAASIIKAQLQAVYNYLMLYHQWNTDYFLRVSSKKLLSPPAYSSLMENLPRYVSEENYEPFEYHLKENTYNDQKRQGLGGKDTMFPDISTQIYLEDIRNENEKANGNRREMKINLYASKLFPDSLLNEYHLSEVLVQYFFGFVGGHPTLGVGSNSLDQNTIDSFINEHFNFDDPSLYDIKLPMNLDDYLVKDNDDDNESNIQELEFDLSFSSEKLKSKSKELENLIQINYPASNINDIRLNLLPRNLSTKFDEAYEDMYFYDSDEASSDENDDSDSNDVDEDVSDDENNINLNEIEKLKKISDEDLLNPYYYKNLEISNHVSNIDSISKDSKEIVPPNTISIKRALGLNITKARNIFEESEDSESNDLNENYYYKVEERKNPFKGSYQKLNNPYKLKFHCPSTSTSPILAKYELNFIKSMYNYYYSLDEEENSLHRFEKINLEDEKKNREEIALNKLKSNYLSYDDYVLFYNNKFQTISKIKEENSGNQQELLDFFKNNNISNLHLKSKSLNESLYNKFGLKEGYDDSQKIIYLKANNKMVENIDDELYENDPNSKFDFNENDEKYKLPKPASFYTIPILDTSYINYGCLSTNLNKYTDKIIYRLDSDISEHEENKELNMDLYMGEEVFKISEEYLINDILTIVQKPDAFISEVEYNFLRDYVMYKLVYWQEMNQVINKIKNNNDIDLTLKEQDLLNHSFSKHSESYRPRANLAYEWNDLSDSLQDKSILYCHQFSPDLFEYSDPKSYEYPEDDTEVLLDSLQAKKDFFLAVYNKWIRLEYKYYQDEEIEEENKLE